MAVQHIVAASPVLNIVLPPTDSAAVVICIAEPAASTIRRAYAAVAADHERFGFKHLSFAEWVEMVLLNECQGHVAPWPGEER